MLLKKVTFCRDNWITESRLWLVRVWVKAMQNKVAARYTIRECIRENCGFRFPVLDNEPRADCCPRCKGAIRVVYDGTLRHDLPVPWPSLPPCEVHAVLDNVRSTFNVGSIFRVADGAGVTHLHLCGITPTPENRKVAKTALGAENSICWTHSNSTLATASSLVDDGISLWALENTEQSVPLFDFYLPQGSQRIALILGNEVTGVDPEVLALCDHTLHIPMNGIKGSLNVGVAFGIAAYWLRGNTPGMFD